MKEKTISDLLKFSIINIDKPCGPTSFGTDVIVKKILGAETASHLGTLDPQVSGVLPISLNRACRLQEYFMHKNKTYVGIMRVHKEISEKEIGEEIKNFLGKIMQKPPVKSRVKREEREREVFSWKILEIDGKDVLFETEVQAGTYIRKLISSLGEKIGGAHMLELRRTKAGIFSEKDSNFVNLYELEKAMDEFKKGNEKELRKILIPGEEAIKKVLPVVEVNEESLKKLYNGSPIFREFLLEDLRIKEGEKFAAFCGDVFVGVYVSGKIENILARPVFVHKSSSNV